MQRLSVSFLVALVGILIALFLGWWGAVILAWIALGAWLAPLVGRFIGINDCPCGCGDLGGGQVGGPPPDQRALAEMSAGHHLAPSQPPELLLTQDMAYPGDWPKGVA